MYRPRRVPPSGPRKPVDLTSTILSAQMRRRLSGELDEFLAAGVPCFCPGYMSGRDGGRGGGAPGARGNVIGYRLRLP